MIIINPGHGRLQAGKRSPELAFDHPLREEIMKADNQKIFRLPEWWTNKKIAENIIKMLPIKAINLVKDSENRGQWLTERIKKGNLLNADLWVGIHSDALGDGSTFNHAGGHHVFYASAEKEAELFNKHMSAMFPNEKNRGIHENPSNQYPVRFAELHMTNCKALITENFFYTNERECRFILDNLEGIALAHVNAIIEWAS